MKVPPAAASPSRPESGSAARLGGVELLRFGAAFAVLIAHYNHFHVHGLQAEAFDFTAQPLFRLFEPFYRYGTRAVEVFWCLSGFVFFHQYGRRIERREVGPGRFVGLRFSRLYPLHLATLLLVAGLQFLHVRWFGGPYLVEINDAKHFGLNLALASQWGLQDGFSFNAPIWSVSLELLAYAGFFVATWLFGARVAVTVALLLVWGVLTHWLQPGFVVTRCLLYFYLGGLAHAIYTAVRVKSRRHAMALALGALLVGVAGLVAFRRTDNLEWWVLRLATPAALLAAAWISPVLPPAVDRAADWLGSLTYASYLLHFPLQLAVAIAVAAMGWNLGFVQSAWFLVGYLGVTLLLSRAVFVAFERPAQTWLRARFGQRPAAA